MTKREAIGILKHAKWIANISDSKRIATAIKTLEEPMNYYKEQIVTQNKINTDLHAQISFIIQKAKEHGIEIKYDYENQSLYFPKEWL